MKTLYKISFCLVLCLLTISCNKWVDVKPTDRLGEDQLFSNKEGYLKALNGVYVEMANRSLYGEEMTAGSIDVLAQYYFINSTEHYYEKYTTFNYTDDRVKATFDNIWSKAYELIANCNVIIEKCGSGPSTVLPESYYKLIKGEALALRAMMHLDMLRLFGPIYNEADKSKPAIPYVNKVGYEISPLLNSEQVIKLVTDDFLAALELLENVDPIRTEGVRNGPNPTGPNDFHYRQYRLNYYAIKALLARAYLWQDNKAEALIQAESLLNEVQSTTKNTFPYVTRSSATNATIPDRLFSTEVMFSLYDINRVKMYNKLFDVSLQANKLSFNAGNSVDQTRVNAIYDDANDYRKAIWQTASTGTITATTNMKYADIKDAPGRYMIPLIRISEVLLIAAECHPDLVTGTAYLNKLRNARFAVNLSAATPTALKLRIREEFRREMLGEGQQFFYYKRTASATVPNHLTLNISPEKVMVLNNYVVPLPESETSQRN